MKEKGKIQIIIIVLSVLLVTGLLILGGIKLYKKNRPDAQQTSATVPDNIITQEEKETKETTDQTTGAEETEAAETETAETEIAEPSSQAPDESKAAEESTAAAATETGTPATTGGLLRRRRARLLHCTSARHRTMSSSRSETCSPVTVKPPLFACAFLTRTM